MRAIAEEAFALVRAYKGSHSGEHGDGIVRSEFHESMFGSRLVRAFEEVKDRFDPNGLYNPGKIVRAPRFDDRENFRFGPNYRVAAFTPALGWSAYPGPAGGFSGATEMCNNNGECRKLVGGVMCPSYRATRDERDVTRGRANALRLAISGQLGADALTSDEMAQTLKLCVSCKACKRECPTGVDMARMKIEVLAARARKGKLSARDRLIAYLPRYARLASRLHALLNLRDRVRLLAKSSERILGLAAERRLPKWRPDRFVPGEKRMVAPRAGKSCCSSTRSTRPSSVRRSTRRCGFSSPRAIGSMSPAQSTAAGGLSAVDARFSRRGWSRRPASRPRDRSPRCCPSRGATFPSSELSPAAS